MANGQLSKALRHILWMVGAGNAAGLTDRQLLERFASDKDESAFETLVQRHGPLVLGVCRRILDNEHDAEDAFQATFLLLARKAGSIFWHESVGNWLYGVAQRIAVRARNQGATRRRHEEQAKTMNSHDTADPRWDDLRPVIDEELERLPEKYRMPLLLCYLHGKTREEAAQQLGWTPGEVKGRLERGREILRNRLVRRGLSVSAAVLPVVLAEGVVSAVPVLLMKTTIQAAAGGALSLPVAVMLKGAMQAMFWTKIKIAALMLVALGLVGTGAGVMLYNGNAGEVWAPLPEEVGKKVSVEGKESEPVIKDGLSIKAKPAKAVFAADEPLALEVTYENVSKQPFFLYNAVNTSGYNYTFTHQTSKAEWTTVAIFRDTREAIGPPVQLDPGQTTVVKMIFDQNWAKRGDFFKTRNDHLLAGTTKQLPQGRWRCTVEIDFLPNDEAAQFKHPFWTGKIAIQPMEFVIGTETTTSAEVVKDGLAVTVTPTKTIFPADERPTFVIAYTNRTDKAIRLNDVGFEVLFWSIIDTKSNGPWQAGGWAYGARPAPRSVQVEAGKTYIHIHNLNGPFVWKGPQKESVPPLNGLPPGKYRITARIAFGQGNDRNPPAYWTSEIMTNPIEFTVGEPAGK